MRIALIQSPVEDFYSTPQRIYPLGLSYLAAAVKNLDVNVEILDFLCGHGRQSIRIPDNFKSIMPFLPYDHSPISAFHSYYHWGLSWKNIEAFFSTTHYDLYAISSNFYTYSQEALDMAKIIKQCHPNSLIVIGGQNVGPEHDLFISSDHIDLCIQGEGEKPFYQLVNALLNKQDISKISGLWNSNSSTWNEIQADINFSDSAAPDLFPPDKYKISGKPAIMIATSRGCPMGCKFCSVSRTFGKKLRLKPAHMIMDEMSNAYKRGIRAFDIEDDNFTFVRSHCVSLLEKIKSKFGNKISLYAMNGISAEHLDEEIISLLNDCGMDLLNLSIATSSVHQLKNIHRKTSIDHFKNIVTIASKYNLKVMGHFISGLPGQDTLEIINTIKVLAELPAILGISPFYYIPGMKMDVPNIPKNYKDARLSRFWPADSFLDEKEMITLFRLSRWVNYLKKKMQVAELKELAFKDILLAFPDDTYIYELITNSNIMGLDSNNNVYKHEISQEIMTAFLSEFNTSTLHI